MNKTGPFKIFVSSPINGTAQFRQAVIQARQMMNRDIFEPKFHVFLYEEHLHKMDPQKTICENILATFGEQMDAFLTFFGCHVGDGVREEFDLYCNQYRNTNPQCKVWWAQIACAKPQQSAIDYRNRLEADKYLEMPIGASPITLSVPEHLMMRVVPQLVRLELGG